jgi:hypothetical protein
MKHAASQRPTLGVALIAALGAAYFASDAEGEAVSSQSARASRSPAAVLRAAGAAAGTEAGTEGGTEAAPAPGTAPGTAQHLAPRVVQSRLAHERNDPPLLERIDAAAPAFEVAAAK